MLSVCWSSDLGGLELELELSGATSHLSHSISFGDFVSLIESLESVEFLLE